MTKEQLEPMVRKILLEEYERKLPPNLFVETPPEREKIKNYYRETFDEFFKEYEDDINDWGLEKTAERLAEYISEMISEECLVPCPDDWQ